MPTRKSVSISLSPELQAVAKRLRASGRYGNISDVMRTALRLLKERELAFQEYRTSPLAAEQFGASEPRRDGASRDVSSSA